MKFLENDNSFRPLRMIHGAFGCRLWHPYFLAMKSARKTLKLCVKKGYGGVVLQAYNGKKRKIWHKHYLTNERSFKYLRGVLKICKKLGLRVWLYDELGYPSGGAAGQVVQKYPDTESYGIICNEHNLKKGESISLTLPYGHEKLKTVLFDNGNEVKDITDFADSAGAINYTATEDGTLYYIASKVLYEGVHPTRKFSVPSRYIDVMDKNAVARFLEITFENYIKYIGEFFGDVVEAVFTDEPSVMNQYFSKLNYQPPVIIDAIDEEIPLFKFVAWSRNFESEFKQRKGYDITPNIPKLFASSGNTPCKIKQDYYEVCRDLYKEAYFEQYSEFCEKLGLKFSGHLLGEETLNDQIINELDFFNLLEPMHYPGIDLLTCEPKNVVNKPLLLKTVSSAAALENKPVVMSETGFHSDDKKDITKEKTLCSLLIEYASGINTITAYLGKMEAIKDKKYCFDRLAKAGQLLEKGNFYSPILFYYPVKSGYAFNKPSEKGHNERDYDPIFAKICDGFNADALEFDNNKLPYTIINSSYLNQATAENGVIHAGKSLSFKAVYIPYCFIEAEEIEDKLLSFARSGVKIFINKDTVLTSALKELENIVLVDSVQQINSLFYEDKDVLFEGNTENITYCGKISEDTKTFMFVNTSAETAEFKVKIRCEKSPVGYNIITDTEFTPNPEKQADYQSISLTLPPYEAKFLVF